MIRLSRDRYAVIHTPFPLIPETIQSVFVVENEKRTTHRSALMDIQDVSGHYLAHTPAYIKTSMQRQTLTFEGMTEHPTYGQCFTRIFRAIRTDVMCTYHLTVRQIKACEPNVGYWPGDRIEYYKDGILIDLRYEEPRYQQPVYNI